MKPEIGMKIKINIGEDSYGETHTIRDVEEKPWNEIVPFSIKTCCGVFIPTSAADGYWEKDDFHRGSYELLVSHPDSQEEAK